jgi:hypothetical protein
MSDLLCCETFDWHRRGERRFVLISVGETCEHTRICSAQSHHIYAHTGARDFECGGLCQPLDCNIQVSETFNGLVHEVAHVLILADISTDKNGLCSEPV